MIDYNKGINLASTIIRDGLRVSTASFPKAAYYGGSEDGLIETWVFSDLKTHSSRQIFSKTREKALVVHNLIVGILK